MNNNLKRKVLMAKIRHIIITILFVNCEKEKILIYNIPIYDQNENRESLKTHQVN